MLSADDVRIVHMESAKIIIAQFLRDASEDKKQVLFSVIETSFLEKEIKPLGLVWLCNGLMGYTSIYRFEQALISEKMISSALGCLIDVQDSQSRVGIAFFMEKVFTMQYEKNGLWYFDKHETLFLDWIAHADNETAYAYARLINTLINTDKERYRQFAKKVNWEQMVSSMMQGRLPDLYAWGELLNRLTYSLTKSVYVEISEILSSAVVELCSNTSISNIVDLSDFLYSIAHIAPRSVHETVRELIPTYREYFRKDMMRAIHLFDFNFFLSICGMSLLGGKQANIEERETAATLVDALPVIEFANAISNSIPRDWKNIREIMHLIEVYDKLKTKEIVAFVDTVILSEMAIESWDSDGDIIDICIALYIGNRKVARKFIEYNQNRIRVISSPLAMIAPECTINLYQKGISVELMTGHWWEISFYALRALIKADRKMTIKILYTNLPDLSRILCKLISHMPCDAVIV